MPGYENSDSVMIRPPMSQPMPMATTVMVGSSELRSTCVNSTRRGGSPLRLAVRT